MGKIIDFVIDSINAGRERLKMSIVTFYISLLALYHWRVFAILFFGGIPMMKKIEEVNSLYKDYSPWFYLINSVSILLVSITFMILFPTIMWLSEKALVYVSIKRKEKKEEEDAADRTKDIEIVRHQFKLKQEETGNLKESEYVDEIKKLRELVHDNLQEKMELEKELNNEREKQKHAITNLKSGFETVESNYIKQIQELSRQLKSISDYNTKSLRFYERDLARFQKLKRDFKTLDYNDKKFLLGVIRSSIRDNNNNNNNFIYTKPENLNNSSFKTLYDMFLVSLKMEIIGSIEENGQKIIIIVNSRKLRQFLN